MSPLPRVTPSAIVSSYPASAVILSSHITHMQDKSDRNFLDVVFYINCSSQVISRGNDLRLYTHIAHSLINKNRYIRIVFVGMQLIFDKKLL